MSTRYIRWLKSGGVRDDATATGSAGFQPALRGMGFQPMFRHGLEARATSGGASRRLPARCRRSQSLSRHLTNHPKQRTAKIADSLTMLHSRFTDDEAKRYTVENILKGSDGWKP